MNSKKNFPRWTLKYMIVDTANFNPNFNIGSVLDQVPNAGAMVKGGRRVYLTLNSSDFKEVKLPKITWPDFTASENCY
ncbi:MAG: hypothetical protein ACJ0PA_04850 [Flavobacteriaceae bacterium]